MKPTTTVADFIRQGRQAGQDALGIAHDPEAIMAMAMAQRERFLCERTEQALRRWRELVAEIAASVDPEPAIERWLGIEHVRLDRAFNAVALADATLLTDGSRWIARLDAVERDEVTRRFEFDLMAPLKVAAVGSRG